MNRLSVPPLHSVTQELAAVASGRCQPQLVIAGARSLSVYTDRILSEREFWIQRGRIAAVKPSGTAAKSACGHYYDAEGGIIAPGLVDPHIHIESSMMSACAYAEAALLNGTTTLFCDSHEIGNVCDREGIEWMLEDSRAAPLNIFLTIPSTIPATNPGLETAGGDLTAKKIGSLFDKWPEAVALGEKMDFVPVCVGDKRSHAIIAESLKRGRPVSGHIYGREFVAAYAASGVTDTHEAIDREIAEDFVEAGIWIFLRGGPPTTPWHSLPEAIKVITELGASHKRVCVCTDDRDADDLFMFGLDWVARQAVEAGMRPTQAWSMASLHPAMRYGMDMEIGGLGHSRRADLTLLNDDYEVQNTWYGGELVVQGGSITPLLDEQLSNHRYNYPDRAYQTVTLAKDLKLVPDLPMVPVRINIIRTELPGIVTLRKQLEISTTLTKWEPLLFENDLCFLAVVERHGMNGGVAHGVLQIFGLKSGAVASTIGHDAHNLVVAGKNEEDMQLAVSVLRENNGGVVVVENSAIMALVSLPIAGLLSDKRATEVANEASVLKKAWKKAGCTLPYMGFNLITLSVIPEIRITDKGLVAVPEMELLPLYE